MKKVLFFLFFFIIINTQVFSKTISPHCNANVSEGSLRKVNQLLIKNIQIDINKYRKWTVNSIKIITGNFRFVPSKYKTRFKAKILVTYEDGSECSFKGKVRHSGDEKDHISLLNNTIIQSLDVHLVDGNIRGITKFKLLRPKTRGNLDDEILLTELLRNLNYLAPRTIKVNARINEANSIMIFQEKAAKELLEFNKRREGPILEGDERFFFKLVENFPDNQLSNWKAGIPELISTSVKAMLAKQTNANIILRNENYKNMSFNSSTNLNLIYLYYSNKFQDKKNNFHYFDYDLDNTLLGFFDSKNILKLDIYNLLIQATNSQHGLSPNNRKFYWNSIENYFEPINYDSNVHIESEFSTTTTVSFRHPVSTQFDSAFVVLEKKIKNLDLNKIHIKLLQSGINLTKEDLDKKINKILLNLVKIKKVYLNVDKEALEHNKFKPMEDVFSVFHKTLEKIDPNIYLVKYDENYKTFQRCKIYLKECSNFSLSPKNVRTLLEGELVLNGEEYQYMGKNTKSMNFIKPDLNSKMKFKKTNIFYSEGIEIKPNLENNTLDIYQNKPGARVFILGGELKDTIVNFSGFKKEFKNLPNYPIDIKGLTGCLTFVNINLKDILINANRSTCEDSVNLINVKGNIKDVNIQKSFMDGLDIDFSDVEINQINISDSKNDCLDLSFGQYKLKKVNLSNCGDKGLSVGEQSFVQSEFINITNSNIGVASKDSSITELNNANLENTKICVTAYNKKQEFYGGFLKIQNIECKNYNEKVKTDSHSEIIVKNEI